MGSDTEITNDTDRMAACSGAGIGCDLMRDNHLRLTCPVGSSP